MDKRKKVIDVIKTLYSFQDGDIDTPDMIKVVYEYYDLIKSTNLTQSDLQFLKKLANTVGIPHYFDHLNNFQNEKISFDDISLNFDTKFLFFINLLYYIY